MIDLYAKSTDLNALVAFCGFFTHVIGPNKGTVGGTDEEGNEYPARGNPDYWYACIRGPVSVTPDAPIEVADQEEGIQVCGVWA